MTWAASADDEPCPEDAAGLGAVVSHASRDTMAAVVDLAIVAGGDGMILRSPAVASAAGVPVLGVNLGRRGFVAEVEPHGPAAPAAIAAGRSVEERLALDVGVSSDDPARPLWTSRHLVLTRMPGTDRRGWACPSTASGSAATWARLA